MSIQTQTSPFYCRKQGIKLIFRRICKDGTLENAKFCCSLNSKLKQLKLPNHLLFLQ